jgi:phosphatidylserine decarboxylase
MKDGHGILDSITNAFVPIHRDGYKFVAGAAIVTLLLFSVSDALGWLGAIATAYCAYFFRDPERVVPERPGLVVSAADGKIASVMSVTPPTDLALGTEARKRVSVFLSIFPFSTCISCARPSGGASREASMCRAPFLTPSSTRRARRTNGAL